jgi:hypothetical protein
MVRGCSPVENGVNICVGRQLLIDFADCFQKSRWSRKQFRYAKLFEEEEKLVTAARARSRQRATMSRASPFDTSFDFCALSVSPV